MPTLYPIDHDPFAPTDPFAVKPLRPQIDPFAVASDPQAVAQAQSDLAPVSNFVTGFGDGLQGQAQPSHSFARALGGTLGNIGHGIFDAAMAPADVMEGRASINDPATQDRLIGAAGMMTLPLEGGSADALGMAGRGAPRPGGAMSARDAILQAIQTDPSSAWGLRVTDDPLTVGGTAAPSRVWRNGVPTARSLSGTSVVHISGATPEAVDTAIANAGIGQVGPNGYYYGQHVSLLKGQKIRRGADVGEITLRDPTVHSVFEKEGSGPDPFVTLTPVDHDPFVSIDSGSADALGMAERGAKTPAAGASYRPYGPSEEMLQSIRQRIASLPDDMTFDTASRKPVSFVDPSAPSWSLYHGTGVATDFDRFDPHAPSHFAGRSDTQTGTLFFSPAADEAANYAEHGVSPRIFPVQVNAGKTALFDLPAMMKDPAFLQRVEDDFSRGDPTYKQSFRDMVGHHMSDLAFKDAVAQIGAERFPDFPSEQPTIPYQTGVTDTAVKMAREQGLDTAVIRGLGESNGGDQVVVLTPNRVFSRSAGTKLYSGGRGFLTLTPVDHDPFSAQPPQL